MSKVRVHNFSISLDGFAAGEDQSCEAPFGHAGTRLVEWAIGTSTFQTMFGVLGRGVRLWDGLESLEERLKARSTSSPSGVTHVAFTRI